MTHPTRSWLFTPGTRPDRFANASTVGADVLIIDLEDAVAPAEKAAARHSAITFLKDAPEASTPARALRINGLDTAHGIADLDALLAAGARPDYVVLPKTDGPDHIRILDRLMAQAGLDIRLIGLIESARGLTSLDAIATASPRLHGLMLGAADMAADLGAEPTREALAHVRGRLVAACALASVAPIDSPFFDVHDADGLGKEVRHAVALGFQAKAAIHPRQVAAINGALTPSEEAVTRARAVLAENAKGVGVIDGQMIDEAVARRARRVLAAVGG